MSSQGMLLASCCCAPQPFLCQDWQACLPRRALLSMSVLEIIEEIVGGTPRYTSTLSKSISCELEVVLDAFGNRSYLRNLPGASGAYFFEELFYEVPRGAIDPTCSIPCNANYLCKRIATQLQSSDIVAEVRCGNPCSAGFGLPGNAYTNISAYINGTAGTTTTYSNQGICFNTGQDSFFESMGAVVGMQAWDVEPQCVDRFSNYVISEASAPGNPYGSIPACSPVTNGFVCDPFVQGNVLSAIPAMSLLVESCPELICEDYLCAIPDPADPFGIIIVQECGCENLFPGSSNNSLGERIRIYRRNVQSNVTLTVTEP